VRTAERRQEIIKSNLVADVNRGYTQAPFVFVTAKQIVISPCNVEQVAMRQGHWAVVDLIGKGSCKQNLGIR